MIQTLGRDQFYGSRLNAAAIGRFSLSLTRYERNDTIPWHSHGESYATVVVRGAYREETTAGTRHCRADDVVIHAVGERHADLFHHGEAICLNIHGAAFERSALLSRSEIGDLAGKLVGEFHRSDALSGMAVEALMLELCVAAARQPESTRTPLWLADVHRILEERFREPLTLADLSSAVGVHPGHLSRAFRRHFGTTVGAAMRELRVGYAKQRLASSAHIDEIALDAGFADQSHLTRTFRKSTGVTPGHFRRRLRSSRSRM